MLHHLHKRKTPPSRYGSEAAFLSSDTGLQWEYVNVSEETIADDSSCVFDVHELKRCNKADLKLLRKGTGQFLSAVSGAERKLFDLPGTDGCQDGFQCPKGLRSRDSGACAPGAQEEAARAYRILPWII